MKRALLTLFILASAKLLLAQDPGFQSVKGFGDYRPILKGKTADWMIFEFGNQSTATINYIVGQEVLFTVSFGRITNITFTESNVGGRATAGSLAQYYTISGPTVQNAGTNQEINTYTFTQKAVIPADVLTELTVSGTIVGNVGQDITFNGNTTPGYTSGGGNTPGNDSYNMTDPITGVLPVIFGPINATISGSNFSINWQTTSEKNNKEFLVQASADGKEFHTIGTVSTLAENGNSDIALEYAFSKNWSEVSSLLGFPLISALLLIAIALALLVKNRRKAFYLPILVILAFASFMGCRKDDNQLATDDVPDVYIRIGQVDIDGTTQYSRIVKAIKE